MDSDTAVHPRDPNNNNNNGYSGKGYALSGKIMMSAVVILFFIVILMVCLHLYARWYLFRMRRRQRLRNRPPRRTHLVFYVDPTNPNAAHVTFPPRGLDADVLRSLPVFVYSSGTHPDPIECAVCLSEFEEKEMGRTLPMCNHSFHLQCIDMWFHSHSTCPLCRSPVESVPEYPDPPVVPSSDVTETSATSDLCDTCRHEAEQMGPSTSSFAGRRKPAQLVGITIEVPATNFDSESRAEPPSTPSSRSPMYRVLSFTRILSRERWGSASPSSGSAATCGGGPPAAEADIERGKEGTR